LVRVEEIKRYILSYVFKIVLATMIGIKAPALQTRTETRISLNLRCVTYVQTHLRIDDTNDVSVVVLDCNVEPGVV
jgi:hypothetical protein